MASWYSLILIPDEVSPLQYGDAIDSFVSKYSLDTPISLAEERHHGPAPVSRHLRSEWITQKVTEALRSSFEVEASFGRESIVGSVRFNGSPDAPQVVVSWHGRKFDDAPSPERVSFLEFLIRVGNRAGAAVGILTVEPSDALISDVLQGCMQDLPSESMVEIWVFEANGGALPTSLAENRAEWPIRMV